MAKTVVIKREGSNVTATPINSPKMRYYPTLEAAENAIANGEIGVGEVISIKEGNEADERDASLPVGTIVSYYSDNIPSGWLLCDGSEFDTAKYPLLYALLNKNTTPVEYDFNYPDVAVRLKAAVNIVSYQSTSNYYTVPADGYVQLSNGGVSNEGIICYMQRENGTWQSLERITTHTNTVAEYGAIKVYKGMKVYFSLNNLGAGAAFMEIVADKYRIIKAVQGNINEVESAAITALAEQVTKATTFSEAGTFQISTGSTHTVAIPENFSEMLAVYGTPYYMETALVPKGILDINTTYNIDYESGISGGVSTQVVQLRINKSGAITVTAVKQNGSASTGFLTLYFR